MQTELIVIIVALLFSGLFSGLEIAFYSANKLRLVVQKAPDSIAHRMLGFFVKKPAHFLTNILVGNNIALVIYGLYASTFLTMLLGELLKNVPYLDFFVNTILSTFFVLIFAEFLPKAIFRLNPDRLLLILSPLIAFFYFLLYPINRIMLFISGLFLRKRPEMEEQQKNEKGFSYVDLFHLVNEAEDNKQERLKLDVQMFKNAIVFFKVKVRECMVPRTEVVALPENASLEEIRQTFNSTGHSKVLIYRENVDNIVGYVHISSLFIKNKKLDELIMPISITTEATSASDLLKELINKRRSIAVVVDEFGGTAGIVTVEDIIEEIFGEIEDEHDADSLLEEKINSHEFLFSARLEVDYINEKYGLNLPKGDYETLNGLLVYHHENIPKEKSIVRIQQRFTFIITKSSPSRVEEVKLKLT